MKTIGLFVAMSLLVVLVWATKAMVNDKYEMVPEYLPSIEAEFESPDILEEVAEIEIGKLYKLETETETKMQLEEWMRCEEVWKVRF